jgi:hypothetical protein
MMGVYVCRYCGSPDIDAEEQTPRFIAIAIDGADEHGRPDWHYDTEAGDDAIWEASTQVGFRCSACATATDELGDLVRLSGSRDAAP